MYCAVPGLLPVRRRGSARLSACIFIVMHVRHVFEIGAVVGCRGQLEQLARQQPVGSFLDFAVILHVASDTSSAKEAGILSRQLSFAIGSLAHVSRHNSRTQ